MACTSEESMANKRSLREQVGSRLVRWAAFTALIWAGVDWPVASAAGEKPPAKSPLVRVEFTDAKNAANSHTVEGRILVEAQDGGIVLLGRDGVLFNITPKHLKSRTKTGGPFRPFSPDELGKRLQAEFGKDFAIHATKHYVVCSDAGAAYSQWCGALFERLMVAFRKYWRVGPLNLHDPEFPLTAIVFKNRSDFARYATADGVPGVAKTPGYFSIRKNRIVLCDLTGGAGDLSANEINARLLKSASNFKSAFKVATVIHEATHQVAFNSGMHRQYADNPLWLLEGMAMYFETPDLRSRQGWRSVGKVNPFRINQFREYVARRRKPDALVSLISGKELFTNPTTMSDAYAESWALTYYLIKTKRTAYKKYLSEIARKPRFTWDTPETKRAEFKKAFGDDLDEFDKRFLKYFARLRTK